MLSEKAGRDRTINAKIRVVSLAASFEKIPWPKIIDTIRSDSIIISALTGTEISTITIANRIDSHDASVSRLAQTNRLIVESR